MIVPPPPVVVQVQPPPRRTARGPIAVLVVLAVLVAAAAGMLVAREMSAPTDVALEPVATTGADPFMPAVGTDAVSVQPVAHTGGRRSGTTPGLYGGSGSDAVCDRGRLSRFLAEHPDRAAGWASVLGLGDSSSTTVSRYVDGLTSVVLRSDTYVTNHGWSDGRVTSWPAVLQAGTAVLVDDHGNPVTRCFCGNPLSAPRSFSSVTYHGPRWVSFTSTAITVITHQTTTVTNNYAIVDVHTGRGRDRPAGSDGHHDTVNVEVTNTFPPPGPTTSTGQDDQQSREDQQKGQRDQEQGQAPEEQGDPPADVGGVTDPVPATDQPDTQRAPLVEQAPADPISGTTPAPENAATNGTPDRSETTPSDTATTTTTTAPAAGAPSGTYSASGCFDNGSVGFSGGSYTVDGAAGGSYSVDGSTLTMTPDSAGPVSLHSSGTAWTDGECTLTEAS